MKVCTNGITRIVFLTRRHAIKIPRLNYGWRLFIDGIRANLNEVELWRIAQVPGNQVTRVRRYLCPIVWSSWGGWIVVMKRAEPIVMTTHASYQNFAIRRAFLEMEKIVGDHKDDNYGTIDGEPVMVDYGSANIDIFEGQRSPTYK